MKQLFNFKNILGAMLALVMMFALTSVLNARTTDAQIEQTVKMSTNAVDLNVIDLNTPALIATESATLRQETMRQKQDSNYIKYNKISAVNTSKVITKTEFKYRC